MPFHLQLYKNNIMMKIYDDTGRGDDFEVSNILYEDDEIIVGEACNEWHDGVIKVMIFKETGIVVSAELKFYYVKNNTQ